ncbi:MAG: alpha-L-fucosidase [Lachnospiraceae bacterium]|nr:alpha-L-fucosidase [Lachnospiraceae bacterium]
MSAEVENKEEVVQQGVHNYSAVDSYVKPTDPAVLEKLEWFQDQKLALMIHWGIYCQLGIVASWALSDKDDDWSRHQVNWTDDGEKFKEQYYALNKSFNPIRFQPKEWAQTAKDCGFKYLILTTKHHDGFCLWNTRYSDYKVTAPDCPYHVSEHADLVKSMFDAFREKGLGIGAYFSKADWHTPYYRTPELPDPNPSDRGPMYSPAAEPERWENFVQYTKNQVLELCEGYGPIDILWFDAGWVCASNGQDIRLGEIVDEARKIQPGILSVDRTVGGPYENYVTPEMCVPEEPLGVPWESCLTLGADFTYEYADRYKSPRELVNTLVGIVAKGGNLALNVSPQPDGRIPVDAMDSLRGLGEWLKVYGEAIYGTRVCAPYQSGNISFTRKGDAVYAIRLFPVAQESVDSKLFIPYAGKVSKVTMLDSGEDVSFVPGESGITVTVPAGRRGGSAPIALVFKLQ